MLDEWGKELPDFDQNADDTTNGQGLAAVLAARGAALRSVTFDHHRRDDDFTPHLRFGGGAVSSSGVPAQ